MPDPRDDVDGLIGRADRAMYEAEQAGRDPVVAAT
jgi:PleD family two-component response regulator